MNFYMHNIHQIQNIKDKKIQITFCGCSRKQRVHLTFNTSTKAINNCRVKQKHTGKYLQEGRVSVPYKFLAYDPVHTHIHIPQITCTLTLPTTVLHPSTHEKHVSRHAHTIFVPRTHRLKLSLQVQRAVIYI